MYSRKPRKSAATRRREARDARLKAQWYCCTGCGNMHVEYYEMTPRPALPCAYSGCKGTVAPCAPPTF